MLSWGAVENVLQSEEGLDVSEDFEVHLGIAWIEKGGVPKSITIVEKDIKSKRSFVQIKNRDNMCLARSIAVGMAFSKYMAASGTAKRRQKRYIFKWGKVSRAKDTLFF